jgi:hypothetical protein
MRIGLTEVALRWEGVSFRAYNNGEPPPFCNRDWSTRLGTTEIEEAIALFPNSAITLLPAKRDDP